jgi:glycosyltransferase involved in cell wall biosynthesis
MSDIDVSICIATYRRPWRLSQLLESIARLKQPDGLRAEVIVIDNDPASDPGSAPAAGAQVGSFPLRWLREPRRNIAHARNRALEIARGRWLAFLDDDEVVDENWLAAYWTRASEGENDGYFGPVLPRFEVWATPWLDVSFYERRRWQTGSAVGVRDARTGNGFVRRALLRDTRFDPAFGRSGGSDTALFTDLIARGARFAWCDEAVVHEVVPAVRQRPGWLARRAFRAGCVHARIQRRLGRVRSRSAQVTRATAAAGVFLAAATAALLGGRARSLRIALRASLQAGKAWGYLGGTFHEYSD